MTKTIRIGIASMLLSFFVVHGQKNIKEINWLTKSITVAETQLKQATKVYTPGHNPRSIWPNGKVRTAPVKDWTTGFFPGSLWYMYEITKDDYFKEQAERFTAPLDTIQYFVHTHDLGFMLNCSFGNGYRLTKNEAYKEVIFNGTKSLASRFSTKVGCIRSWDFGKYKFPVIVDNMMNLEMLMWTAKATNNSTYKEMAITHANTTLKNHFREDNSSYHVVDYFPKNGKIHAKVTHQGYSDESAWARGQAWGLYGYTMMHRETQKTEYLEQAKKIASFVMHHPNLPKDKVVFWDFDARHIPNTYRDVSAAAIIASALIELSALTKNKEYFMFAEAILKSLSTDDYLAKFGENQYFILKHSVGSLPGFSEIDTPLNYADYYYLEALIRYSKLKGIDLAKI